MEDWIYRNLRVYGNASISQKSFKKYGGEEKILEDLRNHDLNCTIRKSEMFIEAFKYTPKRPVPAKDNTTYIIEVIKDGII